MNKAAVTGANGFIGSHLVRYLKEKGFHVRSIILPGTDAASVKPYSDEIVSLDLRSGALEKAVENREIVFHLAALVRDWGYDQDFQSSNVLATRRLYEAAQNAGCGRFLSLSSLAVHAFENRLDAEAPRNPGKPASAYARSKAESESWLLSQVRPDWTIVRPGFWVFGPGDLKTLPPLAKMIQRGTIFWIESAQRYVCTSYVENLAEAIILAATSKKAAGTVLTATDDTRLQWADIFSALGRTLNASPRVFTLPYSLAYALGAANEWLRAAMPVPVALTRYRAQAAAYHCHYKTSPLLHEIGYKPKISFEEGIKRSVEWLKKLGSHEGLKGEHPKPLN